MSALRALAEWAHAVQWRDLPADVQQRARLQHLSAAAAARATRIAPVHLPEDRDDLGVRVSIPVPPHDTQRLPLRRRPRLRSPQRIVASKSMR